MGTAALEHFETSVSISDSLQAETYTAGVFDALREPTGVPLVRSVDPK